MRFVPFLLPILVLTALAHGSDVTPGMPAMVERIIADRYLVHEGRPHGVMADWARHPRGGTTIDATIASANMWGQIYMGVDGDPAALASLRVEIRDVRLLCLTNDGVWHVMHSNASIDGADFREDFAADESTISDRVVNASTGSWAVRLVANRNFHFWSGATDGGWTSTTSYETNGVSQIVAMAAAYKARLVDATGAGTPDPGAVSRARLVASCGGDCKKKDGSYGWDWAEGRFHRLTAQWQPVTIATASRDTLRINPPPLFPVDDADWNMPSPVAGWSAANVGFETMNGTVASQNFDALGAGSSLAGWRVTGGVNQTQTITTTGTTANGTPTALFETRGGTSPVAMTMTADTGAIYRPGALYWMQFNLWKNATAYPYIGRFSFAVYAGDPAAGGVRLGTGEALGAIDGYEAWRNLSWPLSLMTNPAVVIGTPRLFLQFIADVPTNTTGLAQIQLDTITLTDVITQPRSTASYDGTTWTVGGEGSGFYSTWDVVHLVGRHVTGDQTLVTRIASMSDTGATASAGLMMRESDDGDAPFVALQRTGGGSLVMRWRSTAGGAAQSITATGTGPASTWLRVSRVGNNVTTSFSHDGQAWNTIGSTSVPFAITPYLAGMFVSASADGVTNTVAFSASAPTVPNVPTGWSGSYFASSDFSGTPLVRTDAAIDFDWGNGSPLAGIPVDSYTVRWSGTVTPAFTDTYTFTSTSDDGIRVWVGGTLLIDRWVDQAPTASMGQKALSANTPVQVVVEYYERGGGAVARLEWQSASQARQLVPATAPVTGNQLPVGWTAADVSTPGATGSTTVSNDTWTVVGSGADIWGTADEFHFVSMPVTGDVRITAKVVSATNTHAWAKAGVMLRTSTTTGSRHAFTCVTATQGTAFQRRLTTNGTSTHTSGVSKPAPYWVRLERLGTTCISSVSPDGVTWTEIRRETIAIASQARVGLAVMSHVRGTICTAVFTNVVVISAAAAAN